MSADSSALAFTDDTLFVLAHQGDNDGARVVQGWNALIRECATLWNNTGLSEERSLAAATAVLAEDRGGWDFDADLNPFHFRARFMGSETDITVVPTRDLPASLAETLLGAA